MNKLVHFSLYNCRKSKWAETAFEQQSFRIAYLANKWIVACYRPVTVAFLHRMNGHAVEPTVLIETRTNWGEGGYSLFQNIKFFS